MKVSDLEIEVVFIVNKTNPNRAHLTPDCHSRELIPVFADDRHRWTDVSDLWICLQCLGVQKAEPLIPF